MMKRNGEWMMMTMMTMAMTSEAIKAYSSDDLTPQVPSRDLPDTIPPPVIG
jgi:hypothetical protein